LWLRRQDLGFGILGCRNPGLYGYKKASIRTSAFSSLIYLPPLITLKAFTMDSAVSSPQPTILPSQRRSSLLELSEMLRELAEMQVKPETEDAENVPKV
jgi:hypothetical protein